ncbi:MAG: hypothetical protein ACOVQM_20310, partial [Pirellula sp.]
KGTDARTFRSLCYSLCHALGIPSYETHGIKTIVLANAVAPPCAYSKSRRPLALGFLSSVPQLLLLAAS